MYLKIKTFEWQFTIFTFYVDLDTEFLNIITVTNDDENLIKLFMRHEMVLYTP